MRSVEEEEVAEEKEAEEEEEEESTSVASEPNDKETGKDSGEGSIKVGYVECGVKRIWKWKQEPKTVAQFFECMRKCMLNIGFDWPQCMINYIVEVTEWLIDSLNSAVDEFKKKNKAGTNNVVTVDEKSVKSYTMRTYEMFPNKPSSIENLREYPTFCTNLLSTEFHSNNPDIVNKHATYIKKLVDEMFEKFWPQPIEFEEMFKRAKGLSSKWTLHRAFRDKCLDPSPSPLPPSSPSPQPPVHKRVASE
uniref:Uncharacterized protein n=1 Tax=Cacopsylla melanoneura TaxID=428564 RepID=A0A8D8M9J0_9HEMI